MHDLVSLGLTVQNEREIQCRRMAAAIFCAEKAEWPDTLAKMAAVFFRDIEHEPLRNLFIGSHGSGDTVFVAVVTPQPTAIHSSLYDDSVADPAARAQLREGDKFQEIVDMGAPFLMYRESVSRLRSSSQELLTAQPDTEALCFRLCAGALMLCQALCGSKDATFSAMQKQQVEDIAFSQIDIFGAGDFSLSK